MDGITFTSAGLYYSDGLRSLAHSMKENDRDSIRKAAKIIAPLIPKDSCLIPAPGRHGYADHTLVLVEEIVRLTGVAYRDILKGKPRMSQYEAKQNGNGLTEKELGFYAISKVPKDLNPIVLDNVIGSGLTGKAAVHALGKGSVLALAMDDNFQNAHKLTQTNTQTLDIDNEQQLQRQTHSFHRTF